MRCINVVNVNQALFEGLSHIRALGKPQSSRNGLVLVAPTPVITTYSDPTARVLFSPMRNANPFFHLMESLWMLAGRHDLEFPRTFNKRFSEFSDDGKTLHGAYGYRWRKHFKMDQLPMIVEELTNRPQSRRAVLQMWDAPAEWAAMAFNDAKDVPCNTQAYFSIRDDKLDMTVTCRSNDLWWGAYGANAVHFSVLQEYLAAWIGVPVGVYRQYSENFHLYPANLPVVPDATLLETLELFSQDAREADKYTEADSRHPYFPQVIPSLHPLRRVPLIKPTDKVEHFDKDLNYFLDSDGESAYYNTAFFTTVAQPMYAAWKAYKMKTYYEAEAYAEQIKAGDWALACLEWLERKAHARQRKATEEPIIEEHPIDPATEIYS